MKQVCINYILKSKVISIYLFLTVCAMHCMAQTVNLVPDPSFEDTLIVVNNNTQESLIHWKNLDSSKIGIRPTTYVSVNNINPVFDLPINQWANQNPKSGKGCVLMDNFFYSNNITFKRTYCKTKLITNLIAGKTYCVKIYAVFGERYSPYVTDGLQLYFDNGGLDTMISIRGDSTGIYPQVVPQVSLQYVLTDTVNWNLVMGNFVANGTEEFLTIGNFKSDSATNKIVINPGTLNDPGSELLLDDVSVYSIDLANWLPASYGCAIGDTAVIGLPNYETPDAKWFTYNMVLIDSGSQIKVKPTASGTKYICGIDMCNTMVFDTVEVRWWPLAISNEQLAMNNLKVWPNPATNVIQVSNVMGDKVGLYNAVGQLVEEQKVMQNKATMQVGHLPKGVYVVKTAGQVAKVVIQ
jgi:Secretion system C-terminal sorting domain